MTNYVRSINVFSVVSVTSQELRAIAFLASPHLSGTKKNYL